MIRLLGLELNVEEMWVGFFIAMPFVFLIGWWALVLCPINSLLWAIGGAAKGSWRPVKSIRRLGVPAATGVALWACNPQFWPVLLGILPAFAVLSIGYGIPDSTDEGSALGRVMFKFCKGNEKAATYCTRMVIFMLFWLSYAIIFPLVR